MNARYAVVLIMALACSMLATNTAQAQRGLHGEACGHGGFYGYDVGRLYRVLAQNVPHFAAFPPVYYSAPVPRTYGYSPFAYPPGYTTPDLVETPAAVEIVNPHFKASTETASEEGDQVTRANVASSPQVVMNPYASHVVTVSLIGH